MFSTAISKAALATAAASCFRLAPSTHRKPSAGTHTDPANGERPDKPGTGPAVPPRLGRPRSTPPL